MNGRMNNPIKVANESESHIARNPAAMSPLMAAAFTEWLAESSSHPLLAEEAGAVALLQADGARLALHGNTQPEGLPAALAQQQQLLAARMRHGEILPIKLEAGPAHPGGWHASAVSLNLPGCETPIGCLLAVSARKDYIGLPVLQAMASHYLGCLRHRMESEQRLSTGGVPKGEMRQEDLLLASQRLHDKNDVAEVLSEAIHTLESIYPFAQSDLFISQDYANIDPRVKPLLVKNASPNICVRSFLEGIPLTERHEGGMLELVVPITGKQAVYGVIRMMVIADIWVESELNNVAMIANTVGSAFENAKLFEQSNLLISELQLINELAKRLNKSLRLKEVFEFAVSELLAVFGADYCCIALVDKDQQQFTVMSSNLKEVDNEQFSTEYGFSGVVYRTKEPLIIPDYRMVSEMPSKLMACTQSRSLIAAPIINDTEVLGAILVTHRKSNYFSYENYKLLQMLTTHVGLAVINASLHAAVRRMAITDHLTGLHVRNYLNEEIQKRLAEDCQGSLIVVDIDHFKLVNDTYGHLVGDQILIQVSDIIRSVIRERDIAARWGGEELAIYLLHASGEGAMQVAEQIRQRVEAETHPRVTISCGTSAWSEEDERKSVESLFHRADVALYAAKHQGRNRVIAG